MFIPWRTCGESDYACTFGLCACDCFACCDHSVHYAPKTCCSGASQGLCSCRWLLDCPSHKPWPNWGPGCVLPESLASGSNCGTPGNACRQRKMNKHRWKIRTTKQRSDQEKPCSLSVIRLLSVICIWLVRMVRLFPDTLPRAFYAAFVISNILIYSSNYQASCSMRGYSSENIFLAGCQYPNSSFGCKQVPNILAILTFIRLLLDNPKHGILTT